MKFDAPSSAALLYRFYSNFCHQFAHRSWFLFGEQSHYPPANTNSEELSSYEKAFGNASSDQQIARATIGNDRLGYKVAICQRDVAIYLGLILFCIIFQVQKRKSRRISLLLWIVFAVAPMGIDGIIQFITGMNYFSKFGFVHESNPILRTITGLLFGFFTGWYLLPAIEETFIENSKGGRRINAN